MLRIIVTLAWILYCMGMLVYNMNLHKTVVATDYLFRTLTAAILAFVRGKWAFAVFLMLTILDAIAAIGMLLFKLMPNIFKMVNMRKVNVFSKEYNRDIIAFSLRTAVYLTLTLFYR